jgi:hypothetical protein
VKQQLPDIVVCLTGKGPLKDYYVKKFSEKELANVKVFFLWLKPADYPLLLGKILKTIFHKFSIKCIRSTSYLLLFLIKQKRIS